MPRTQLPYSEDFKKQAVDLVLSGPDKPLKQIARELGVSVDSLRDWKNRTLIHGKSVDLIPPPKDDSLAELQRVNRQLREQLVIKERANEILKKAIAICSEWSGISTPMRSLEQMAKTHSRIAICQTLHASRSASYAEKGKPFRLRRCEDAALTMKIKDSFLQSRRNYASPRIRADLQDQGIRCGKNRINRLMRQLHLRPKQKRKFKPTTTWSDPDSRSRVAENWLGKIPAPDRINHVWQADITYIATREGWLYLAGIMDCCSRKIVGSATSESLETSLVTAAWNQAIHHRRPHHGLLHHSDRGCQYTSEEFAAALKASGAAASMSRKGNCYDNAHKESFWATLKTECFGDDIPQTKQEAKRMIFDYIHTFYNTTRRHSSLGMLSPNQFEKNLLHKNQNN